MANKFPRIEWKNFTLVGDTTISNAILTNIPDTAGTEVAMTVTGTGIPAGTTVLSFTATTITLSANATASNASVTFTLFFFLNYELPLSGDNDNERQLSNIKKTVSTNGKRQNQFNFIEIVKSHDFVFIVQTILDTTRTFMETHALKGKEFKYFESNDEAAFVTVELNPTVFLPKKLFPDDTGGFIYDFNMKTIRTL